MNGFERNWSAGGPATPGNPGGSSAHVPPPGAGFMNGLRWVLFVVLLLLAVVSIASYVVSKQPKRTTAQSANKVIYQCPMHPSYTSDKPGECPICGMTLEKVEVADAHGGHEATHSDVPGLAAVTIAPERVQMIGVRTAIAQRRALGGQLELVGFVTPDETRLKRVQIRVSGWVERLFVNRTGERVSAGDPLLMIYSPELYQSEREYLIEHGVRDTMAGMGHEAGASQSAEQRLRLLGVPEDEIRRLAHEGTAGDRLTLRSPVSGTVLERGVAEGQYVSADTPLFSIADLSRVWVLADLYEMDVAKVRVGDRVRFTADAQPSRPLESRVDFIYPTVSNETRTIKVRLALDNHDGALRPGMYGRVGVSAVGASVVAVPTEAVVNAGEHTYLFIARAGGHFEPRMVWTGAEDGDWTQILKGVSPGDTVVSSASFLIDSESRLKAAIAGMGAQPGAAHQHGGTP